MKIIFWMQIAFALMSMTLNAVIYLMGGNYDTETYRFGSIAFVISAGFLWVHSAIVDLRAKP